MKLSWILTALLLTTLFSVQPAVAQDSGRPQPTGDALFDKYAAAVWDTSFSGDQAIPAWISAFHNPTTLPDSQLLQWEADWGDDPRWWELRWYCASRSNQFLPGTNRDQAAIIDEAIAAGHASPALLLIKYCELAKDSVDSEKDEESGIKPVWDLAELSDLHGLLDALELAAPDHALPFFESAMLHFSAGEFTDAALDLERCTAAGDQSMILPFPVSEVVQQMQNGEAAGSPALSGMILNGLFMEMNPYADQFRSRGSAISRRSALKLLKEENYAGLQNLHLALLAIMPASFSDSIAYKWNLTIVRHAAGKCLVEYPDRFSENQRREIYGLITSSYRLQTDNDLLLAPRNLAMDRATVMFSNDNPLFADLINNAPEGEAAANQWTVSDSVEPNTMWLDANEELWNAYSYIWFSEQRNDFDEELETLKLWDWTKLSGEANE